MTPYGTDQQAFGGNAEIATESDRDTALRRLAVNDLDLTHGGLDFFSEPHLEPLDPEEEKLDRPELELGVNEEARIA